MELRETLMLPPQCFVSGARVDAGPAECSPSSINKATDRGTRTMPNCAGGATALARHVPANENEQMQRENMMHMEPTKSRWL
jgi:hypothetical protein